MPGHSRICMVQCTYIGIHSVDRYQVNTGVLYISVQFSQGKQKATETKERNTLKEPKQSKTHVEILDQKYHIAGCKQCSKQQSAVALFCSMLGNKTLYMIFKKILFYQRNLRCHQICLLQKAKAMFASSFLFSVGKCNIIQLFTKCIPILAFFKLFIRQRITHFRKK